MISGGADKRVKIWDLESKSVVDAVPVEGPVRSIAGSPDGGKLYGVYWNRVSDLTATPPARFGGHRSDLRALTLSTDGETLVSGDEAGRIIVWDIDLRSGARFRFTRGSPIRSWFFTNSRNSVITPVEPKRPVPTQLSLSLTNTTPANRRSAYRLLASRNGMKQSVPQPPCRASRSDKLKIESPASIRTSYARVSSCRPSMPGTDRGYRLLQRFLLHQRRVTTEHDHLSRFWFRALVSN